MSLNRFLGLEKTMEEYIKSYREQIFCKEIAFDDIVFTALAHLKCMNCGMFRRNYHCLASPRWRQAKEILSKYNKFYLVYARACNKERIEGLQRSNADRRKEGRRTMNDWLVKRNACNANQVILYSRMKRFLVDFNKEYGNKEMKLFGAGGGCRGCKVCGLIKPIKTGEKITPCAKPNESFNAPESWGIDVYMTLRNVGIEFEVIPEMNLINVGLIAIKEKENDR